MIETFGILDSAIENLFDALEGYELSYAYNGDFTQKLTDSILSLSETNLEVINEPIKNRKKVYFIMVESLQNITRHQDAKVVEGFFSIHKGRNGFLITSGNIIENSHIPELKEKLEKVNSMSPDELKEYYYTVLSSEGFSEKGGAGLGLIEMVRKSGNKLSYDFDQIDKTYSYFNFQINVKTNPEDGNLNENLSLNNLSLAKGIYKTINENNVKLFFHGKFEHESLKGLIAMTESSLSNSLGSTFKKIIVAVMIEMLQNICYHGVDKIESSTETPGLILICEEEGKYAMITGNYIANDKVERFLNHVNEINALDDHGLNSLFNQVILKENRIGERGAGLGLIDLRFKTKTKIETNVLKRSETRSFLIIKSHINY